MDVHVFLFSDMLLLCKNLTKVKGDKGNSGSTGHHYGPATGSANPYGPGTDAKVKVIRQPYVIDRLVVVDISKDAHSGSQGRLIVVMYHCNFGTYYNHHLNNILMQFRARWFGVGISERIFNCICSVHAS